MGLGITWWANGGESSRWFDDWSPMYPTTGLLYHEGNMSRYSFQGQFGRFFQRCYSNGTGAQGPQQKNPGFDSGYFYLEETSTGEILYGSLAAALDDPETYHLGTVGAFQPRYHELYPPCRLNDLAPGVDAVVGTNQYVDFPFYRTAWWDVGTVDPTSSGTQSYLYIWFPKKVGTWRLGHYVPWAWSGTVPEVVAAIMMKMGISTTYIDTTAFDNAYDAYDPTTGDSPYRITVSGGPLTVYASRKVGQKVSDLIFDVAMNSRDFFFADEAGVFSCNSFVRPNTTVTGLGLSDGVLAVSWERTTKYIINSVTGRYGDAVRQWGDQTNRPDNALHDLSCVDEPQLDSYVSSSKWFYSFTSPTSITKYGERPAKGRKTIVNTDGSPREAEVVHFPMQLDPDWTSGARPEPVSLRAWLNSDAQPRKLITVRQDLRGADYGLGDKVEDVELTGDGATVADTRCIEKEYNFDSLTVTSVLMEVPDNTVTP